MDLHLYLLALTSSEFLEALKWAAIVGTGIGAVFIAYRFGRVRDKKLSAVARQVGADLIEDIQSPDPSPLTEQLTAISTQIRAVPGQINTAILGAETRLGNRIQSLTDMDAHLLRQIENDRRAANEHRREVISRIGQLETRKEGATRREDHSQ